MLGRGRGAVRVTLALMLAGVVVAAALAVFVIREADTGGHVRLATFYRPLTDGPPPHELASQLGIAVLTRTDESYRDALREAGFAGPILQYLLANQTSGPPGLLSTRSPCGSYPSYPNNPSGITGDFCAALHGDERNFLHNGRGERLYSTQSWIESGTVRRVHLYLMNPGASGWRTYVAARAHAEIGSQGYSGIFLDNVDLSLHRGREQEVNSDGTVAEYASDAAYRQAVAGLLQSVRAEIGAVPLWANLTNGADAPGEWDTYLPELDGVMQEAFVAGWDGDLTTPAAWDVQTRQAEAILLAGKGFMAVAQGERHDVSRMRFALATYLLIARDGISFRYADGSGGENTSPDYYKLWTYEEYGLDLGPAWGSRYHDGKVWRRDFACGLVTVHVEERRGTIETRPGCASSVEVLRARIAGQEP